MGRAPCCDKANVKKGPWSPEEDAKLKAYIDQNGTGNNWIALPQKIGLKRCGKSCRLRWLNYLRPNIKHGGFSEEEDHIICSLYLSIGSRWSVIAAQLPGRTDNDIKNYWNTRLKKKLMGKQQQQLQQRQRKEQAAAARNRLVNEEIMMMREEGQNMAANFPITTTAGDAMNWQAPPDHHHHLLTAPAAAISTSNNRDYDHQEEATLEFNHESVVISFKDDAGFRRHCSGGGGGAPRRFQFPLESPPDVDFLNTQVSNFITLMDDVDDGEVVYGTANPQQLEMINNGSSSCNTTTTTTNNNTSSSVSVESSSCNLGDEYYNNDDDHHQLIHYPSLILSNNSDLLQTVHHHHHHHHYHEQKDFSFEESPLFWLQQL